MQKGFDGPAIAQQRIDAEARDRTGVLDLSRLGLTALPEGVLALTHLRALYLGRRFVQTAWGLEVDWATVGPNNQIGGLERLAVLRDLTVLSIREQTCDDIGFAATLNVLQSLDCSGTQVADLAPLEKLNALQSLHCSDTQVADLAPLEKLNALQSLHCSFTQVADLAPLEKLNKLQSLDCSNTQVADLAPLARLNALQSLHCSRTQVADLAPLEKLNALQSLDCSGTQVADLAPLEKLNALQSLDCRNTQVADLAPLEKLNALQSLDCSGTQVADLAPLEKLNALQCNSTQVADLAPLKKLNVLQSLQCNSTQVADLAPLEKLNALQSLHCSFTQVADLAPLEKLNALQSLHCSYTQVADLAPLEKLNALQSLDCSGCRLKPVSAAMWHKASLTRLVMYQTQAPGLPPEVLSQNLADDCLESLRAHLRDLEPGSTTLTDVKLLVLGNGRSGKTQLTRFLCGEAFQTDSDSTHGIRVVNTVLTATQTGPETHLHIWDFGGQDIYHGTHALFVRTRAMFVLVWANNTEPPPLTYEHQGIAFRNHPLQYWGSYIAHLGDSQSPVLVVQTKCDTDAEEAATFPLPDDVRTLLGPVREVRFSAASAYRGHDELLATLRGAVARLWDKQGHATIGVGRLRVQRRIEALRNPDGSLPEAWRLMEQETFHDWCREAGDIESPDQFLRYLHHAGIVFHDPEMFDNQIVLDHAWALNAVYAVFDRTRSYKRLTADHGRFDRGLLEMLVWRNYTEKEQRLFLGMMRSCGICFIYRRDPAGQEDDDTIYIAPDLLPPRAKVQSQIDARWDKDAPTETVTFDYPMLHPGLMRAVIARIGDNAGIDAIYWRGGVSVYETALSSHALIEHDIPDGGSAGSVTLRTQKGQARILLDRLADWINEENERLGLKPTTDRPMPPAPRNPDATMNFGQQPVTTPEYCVSYAWADDSPSGATREDIVDRLCAAADARGIHILRDKTDMRPGDQISVFMRRVSQGNRIFVILSEKYLRSVYCMTELYEIWRNCQGKEQPFLNRIRVFAHDDTRIGDIFQRRIHVRWWRDRHEQVQEMVRQDGADSLSERDYAEFRRMGHFIRHVPDILSVVQDILRPRRFKDLEAYGFDDPPS
jgi:internalin A